MAETKKCSFCGNEIEPGTGKLFIQNNGHMLYFCTSKCEKNMLKLDRKARETRWTQKHARDKSIRTFEKKEKPGEE